MANNIKLPDDSTLTGKIVKTTEINDGVDDVHLHHFVLTGDDGSVIDWGGSNDGNPLGVYPLGTKSGGGFNKVPAETNPLTSEVGLNVNCMPYDAGVPFPVAGLKQSDAAVPGANNIGALVGVASSMPLALTDGRMVAPRVTFGGEFVVQNSPAGGAVADGTKALTSASVAYAVPVSAPSAAYLLVCSADPANTSEMRWKVTSAVTGGHPVAPGGTMNLKLPASTVIYFYSTATAQTVSYSTLVL